MVYRFLDKKGNVLYVGRTNDLRTRMYTHFTCGHLPMECYRAVESVEYIETTSKSDSAVLEMYFINYYNPKYNQEGKNDDKLSIRIQCPSGYRWKKYEIPEFRTNKRQLSICDVKFGRLNDLSFQSLNVLIMLMTVANENGHAELTAEMYRKYRKKLSGSMEKIIKPLQESENSYLKECISGLHIEDGAIIATVKKKDRIATRPMWTILRSFQSRHCLLLALWLSKYCDNGVGEVKMSEFREWMGIPQSYTFKEIKRVVLQRYIGHLKKYFTNLRIEKITHGRKVYALRFLFDGINDGISEHSSMFS